MSWGAPYWLAVLPVLLVFAVWDTLRRHRARLQSWPLIPRLLAGRKGVQAGSTRSSSPVRLALHAGLFLLVIALARPQWGVVAEEVFEQSRDVLLALDLSRSMLADDVSPSRLQRSKMIIDSLLDQLHGERVGLLLFSGTAFLQSPLSSDYEILREFLPSLQPDYLPEGGTNFEAMLKAANDAMGTTVGGDRFLVVLSDGEDPSSDWKSAAHALREKGIRVIALGVGTSAGALIPDSDGSFIKDEKGAVVQSRLNPANLQEMAAATNGTYRDASSWVDLASVVQQTVLAGTKGEKKEFRRERKIERFGWFLGGAALCLAWALWRIVPVHPRLVPVSRHSRSTVPLKAGLALFISSIATSFSQGPPPTGSPLAETVSQLSQKSRLRPDDYRTLAEATIQHAEKPSTPVASSVISDALDAVDLGEKVNPAAADWPALRQKLLDLKNRKEQEKQDQSKKDSKNSGDSKDDGKSQQQQSGSSGDQKSQQNSSGDSQKSQDGNSQGDQKKDGKPGTSGDTKNPQENGKDGTGKKNENQDGQSGKDQAGQPTPKPGKTDAFGKMDGTSDPKKESEKPQPAPAEAASGPRKKVGGGPSGNAAELQAKPELAETLRQLEQVRSQDSPARLYQRMLGTSTNTTSNIRGW